MNARTDRPTEASLIAAIQARGSDATDLRDAAHEAHHALDAKVRGKWDRESIHRAISRLPPYQQLRAEISARAVEQIVCRDLGVDCDTVEKWAFIAEMEMLKNSRLALPPGADMAKFVRKAMEHPTMRCAADRVLALAVAKSRKRAA